MPKVEKISQSAKFCIKKRKKSGSPERLFPYLQLLTYEKKLLLL